MNMNMKIDGVTSFGLVFTPKIKKSKHLHKYNQTNMAEQVL